MRDFLWPGLVALCVLLVWWLPRAAPCAGDGDRLILGAQLGRTEWVSDALDRGAAPDSRDERGTTALMWAASSGDVATMRLLMAAGADHSLVSEHGGTALAWAAGRGHCAAIRLLLDAGADIDQTSFNGGTALHAAVLARESNAARLLVDGGADVNAGSRGGHTPLMAATWVDGRTEIELLLARGADPTARDDAGRTAMDWALATEPTVAEFLREALDAQRTEPELPAIASGRRVAHSR